MRKRHPTIHALVVAPETFERINPACICYGDDCNKRRKRIKKPGFSWPVFRIYQSERKPRASDNFNDYAEREVLTRNKRKEHLICDYENYERKRENPRKHSPSQYLFNHMGTIVPRAAALTPSHILNILRQFQ